MATQCPICEKQYVMAWKRKKLRGKYNPTVKRRKYPNLQWVRLSAEAAAKASLPSGKRIKACAKCIKAMAKRK